MTKTSGAGVQQLWFQHGLRAVRQSGSGLINSAAAVLLAFVLSLTLIAAARPPQITLGAADAALLAGGFNGKEIGEAGRPFRWTNGSGLIRLPAFESRLIVAIGAQSGRERAVRLSLREQNCPIANLRIVPQHRIYQVLWPQRCATDYLQFSGVRELTLLSPTIAPRDTDQRTLGIAVSSLRAIRVSGSPAWEPLIIISLTVLFSSAAAWPLRGGRMLLPWLTALLLPLLLYGLVWAPPAALRGTWLPFTLLPWLIMQSLAAYVIWRLSHDRRGAWLATAVVGGLLIGILIGLQLSWQVDGPDFGWHASRSSDWRGVFRAHGYYPLGFPFILRLGELAGGQALPYARAAALSATLIGALATLLLVWRIVGRSSVWLAALALIGAPITLAYGVLAGTDALFSAWAALALSALCWSPQLRMRQALLGGLALGIAYLFRFQALMLLLPILIWAAPLRCADCPPLPSRAARLLRRPVLLISGGFLIGSAVQWITELIDTGRPINSRQHTNLWNFAFERYDAIPAPPAAQLQYVLSYDPGRLLRHWVANLQSFFDGSLQQLFVWPLGLIVIAAIATALSRLHDQRYRLLIMSSACYLALVALSYNKARFFLPLMPALTTLLIAQLADWQQRLAGGRLRRQLIPLFVILLWLTILASVAGAAAELTIYRR